MLAFSNRRDQTELRFLHFNYLVTAPSALASPMIEHLSPSSLSRAEKQIRNILESRGEWFCLAGDARIPSALRRGELDVWVSQSSLIFFCIANEGIRFWRVLDYDWTEEKLVLNVSRRGGAERTRLELVPRAPAVQLAEEVRAARLMRTKTIAELASKHLPQARIERVGLNPSGRRIRPGRYGRILFLRGKERIAITAMVAENDPYNVDAFLSSALMWISKSAERATKFPVRETWLVVPSSCVEALKLRIPLLSKKVRRSLRLFQIDDSWQELSVVDCPELEAILAGQKRRLSPTERLMDDEWLERIVSMAPSAIDVVWARRGATLRFQGLSFARSRNVGDRQFIWFGIDGSQKRLLAEDTWNEFASLFDQLLEHRRPDAVDRQHALYKAASEAWLESLLRRDITKLDPGLVIAPVHAQFRASESQSAGARPVDLLARRHDGRLVVIELKTSEDRGHVLQGADYWRQVESHRRRGNIERARLFGDFPVSAESPLVYLVAPMLSFSRAYQTLALCFTRQIEMYRFEINEDWRAGVRVVNRRRILKRNQTG